MIFGQPLGVPAYITAVESALTSLGYSKLGFCRQLCTAVTIGDEGPLMTAAGRSNVRKAVEGCRSMAARGTVKQCPTNWTRSSDPFAVPGKTLVEMEKSSVLLYAGLGVAVLGVGLLATRKRR